MIKETGIIVKNFNLKNISSFKIGGKAKYYYIPDELTGLQNFLHSQNGKIYIIGNASNILFNDIFFNGTIINLKGFTNYIVQEENYIRAGAGTNLETLINYAIDNSLQGLEKLSGIPGTIGGALFMNAGAFNAEIGSLTEYVKVLTYTGKILDLPKSKIKFSYRKASPLDKYIILEAGLKLKKGNKKILLKIKNEILKKRDAKQPLDYPSCGSIFKRPKNNYAGVLIEKCGLKGYKIGKAQVSEKHANFIINTRGAKAMDVMNLIKYIQSCVYNKFKVRLEPEIKFFNF